MNRNSNLLVVLVACASACLAAPAIAVEADLFDRFHSGPAALAIPLVPRGQDGAVSYRRTSGSTLLLSARSRNAVLCAKDTDTVAGPRLVVDPNGGRGEYSGLPMGNFHAKEWMESGRAPLSYGVEQLPFSGANYNFYPADQVFRLSVEDVGGYCVEGLAQPSQPPSDNSICSAVVPSTQRVYDLLHRGSFEAGALKMATEIITNDPPSGAIQGMVEYRHILWAEGGSVDGIRFREQFPHYFGAPSDFRDALALDAYWTCQPGTIVNGQTRGVLGRGFCNVISGRGYISSDSLALEENGCVVLKTTREWTHSANTTAGSFSGAIHSAAFHAGQSAAGNGLPGVEQSLIRFAPLSP